ncbi:thiosulfohydrolase SoxB [Frigidibacter albus]
MISRREFLQASMAASALWGSSGFGNWSKLAAQQVLTQDQLLQFDDFGNLTLIHITDIHAQAEADLVPRTRDQPRRRRGQGQAAACHRQGLPADVRHSARLA